MGDEGINTGTAGLPLRDELVHSIYAMLDSEDEWPHLLRTLDAYFSHTDPLAGRQGAVPLLEHMERAELLLEKMAELRLKTSYTDKMLDRMPMGIALVSPEMRITSINARATSLLDSIDALHRDGRLQLPDTSQHHGLRKIVEQVSGGLLRSAPLSIGQLNLWISRHGSGPDAQVAIYMGHHGGNGQVHEDRLMDHYGLTEKEAMLTARLCDGFISLEEAAESMGIGIGTARSHLKRVFSKTGVQRQADLVKLVLGNPILTVNEPKGSALSEARRRDSQVMRLPNGRTVSWAEYGAPRGRPVLFCHAVTGCRLLIPMDHHTLTKLGLRLIVPDRAGFGLSSSAECDCMQQWIEDIELFRMNLGIQSWPVIGHSAGGAFALQLAAEKPEQVEKLVLIGSVVPLTRATDVRELLRINRVLIFLARISRIAARAFLGLSMRVMVKRPDSYFGLINKHVARLDEEVLRGDGFRQLLAHCFRETTRQGTRHMREELLALAADWRFDPVRVACPLDIWHGKQDRLTPTPLVERFAARLRVPTDITWVDDAGYFLHFHHWQDILKKLKA